MARMVSLRRSPADRVAEMMPAMPPADHDPGLCLALSERTLEALGVDDDVEVGNMLHLMVIIEATSVHKTADGLRIEAAIIAGRVEDETTEGMDGNEEEEAGE